MKTRFALPQGASFSSFFHAPGAKRVVAALMLVLVLGLGGCGKRPGQVLPPEEAKGTRFPQTYPNPATMDDPL